MCTPPPQRKKVTKNDLRRAIQHAKNICYNFEDTPACRIAWEKVEDISDELESQTRDKVSETNFTR